ncbi:MAG: carboxypeptidase-like regulatory domain-containing protein, partial [Bacteroidia bacterium]
MQINRPTSEFLLFIAGFLLLFCPFALQAQQKIQGKIIDLETREPIPFANIVFDLENKRGTTADLSGNFSIETREPVSSLKISHISYETRSYSLGKNTENLIITLEPKSAELEQVFII